MLPDYFISFCMYYIFILYVYRNWIQNLTVHIENEHTKNTEWNPFNKPKRDTMSWLSDIWKSVPSYTDYVVNLSEWRIKTVFSHMENNSFSY